MFVKPSNSGSSVGVKKAENERELVEAINYAAQFDKKVLVEEKVSNVKEANITRDFVGRGYVKVTKGENTTISYADINVESSARSLKTVAAAIQGTDFYNNQLNDYQRSLVDTWAAK